MDDDGVFLAGQVVPPGTYRRVDVANGRVIELAQAEPLPASLDGTIAQYRRVVPLAVRADAAAPSAPKRLVAID